MGAILCPPLILSRTFAVALQGELADSQRSFLYSDISSSQYKV